MAPRPAKRGDGPSPRAFHELGVRGRKTGAVLHDTGKRDEHNMQPLDDIFTSPQAAEPTPQVAATPGRNDSDNDGSVAMDIATTPGPGPATVLGNQKRLSHNIPKGRSPIKTNLKSPAIRNPHISSPARQSTERDARVQRTINFPATGGRTSAGSQDRRPPVSNRDTGGNYDEQGYDDVGGSDISIGDMVNQSIDMVDANMTDPADRDYRPANAYRPAIPPPRGTPLSAKAKGKQKATSGISPGQARSRFNISSDNDYDVPDPEPQPPSNSDPGPAFDPEPEPEPSPEPAPMPPPRSRPSPKQTITSQTTTQKSLRPEVPKKRTPAAASTTGGGQDDNNYRQPSKRPRTESVVSKTEPPKRGRGRPPKNGPAKRLRGRPRKSEADRNADEEESLFMTLQRGPPMPRSRGLVSVRHVSHASNNTRRGYSRPVEELNIDDGIYEGGYDGGYGGGSDDYADDQIHNTEPRRAGSVAHSHGRRRPPHLEEADLEDWEVDPGAITGEIVLWEPEHETQPPADDDPVHVTDERVAIAASAIQTTEIRDSAVRYAKTLATPFMGAGVVDLPPMSEKRPKNSRKMHMVFVVHYGKVTVTINEAQFRISAGGMWFVPRGNYYSITNESEDAPSRVYFSQACEVAPVYEEMTETIMA